VRLFSRWIRFVFFFFFALWCWAIMRLQHQLTPTAVRRLRHLLLLGFELPQASSLKHGRAIHQQQVADSSEGNLTDPDFKHKKTQQTLWLDDKLKPPWVDVELASLTQRRQGKRKQQSSVFFLEY
jgi:hypothetical protein